jgi:homoserine dehydrogenase
MGGKVFVDSKVGEGTTFTTEFSMMCKIPLSQSLIQRQAQAASQENSISEEYNMLNSGNQDVFPKPICLLVNDSPFLLMAYKEQLSEQFKVVTAENGLQAV